MSYIGLFFCRFFETMPRRVKLCYNEVNFKLFLWAFPQYRKGTMCYGVGKNRNCLSLL